MESRVEDRERRGFFSQLWTIALSLMGCLAAVVGIGFLYPVARRKPPALFVCLESEIKGEEPLAIKDTMGRNVLLMRKDSGELLALGTICPHLGCTVYYRPKKKIFECPCHQGIFDSEGNPISGPPENPLYQYPTEVREGKVFVQFTRL